MMLDVWRLIFDVSCLLLIWYVMFDVWCLIADVWCLIFDSIRGIWCLMSKLWYRWIMAASDVWFVVHIVWYVMADVWIMSDICCLISEKCCPIYEKCCAIFAVWYLKNGVRYLLCDVGYQMVDMFRLTCDICCLMYKWCLLPGATLVCHVHYASCLCEACGLMSACSSDMRMMCHVYIRTCYWKKNVPKPKAVISNFHRNPYLQARCIDRACYCNTECVPVGVTSDPQFLTAWVHNGYFLCLLRARCLRCAILPLLVASERSWRSCSSWSAVATWTSTSSTHTPISARYGSYIWYTW